MAAGIDALALAYRARGDGPGPRLGPIAVVERLGAIPQPARRGLADPLHQPQRHDRAAHRRPRRPHPPRPQPPDRSQGGAFSTAAATTPVDAHDPPPPMRESVIIRDGTCCFPGCRVDVRACDLDHMIAYLPLDQGGPPGQTSPENLACLCRRHHRLKTLTARTYTRLADGRYR